MSPRGGGGASLYRLRDESRKAFTVTSDARDKRRVTNVAWRMSRDERLRDERLRDKWRPWRMSRDERPRDEYLRDQSRRIFKTNLIWRSIRSH